jgi:hypothetical protein
MEAAENRGFVSFDSPENRAQSKRADIIFGPDLHDPRIGDSTPLTDAMREGRSDVEPSDLGKTVGEVYGYDIDPAELRERMLENARSIRID